MSNLHLPTPGMVETLGALTGSTSGVSIGTSGITQIAASTSFDYDAININAIGNNITADAALDIYLGASGSEYTLIDKLRITKANTNPQGIAAMLPLAVPRGSRISGRAYGGALNTIIQGIGVGTLGDRGYKRAVSMGISSNYGVTIALGGSANTLTGWTQIIASTPHHFNALMVVIGNGQRSNAGNTVSWLVDIAIGAAGSEQVIIKQLYAMSMGNTVFFITPSFFGPFPCNVPAGSRISARAQCNTSTATTRNIDVTVYGLIR